MSFANDLKKFRLKAGINMADLKRVVAIKLFSAIVQDTPVGTSDPSRNYVGGRLRNNWQFVRNGDTFEQLPGVDPSGAGALLKMAASVNDTKVTDELVFVNNLPYGPRIEFDGWSSVKAPAGMVRKNVIRFQKLISREARRISRR